MKWNRLNIKRIKHKKGPKKWKERMAIEYEKETGLHSASMLMTLSEHQTNNATMLLMDYKIYLLRKALNHHPRPAVG